ncbi:hypothetical protein CWS72_25850 [Telmatospirillum siberiense]|uniref:Uncharacterized protein n=1 Tax=Telmatospirillum siberiense TaxID=382514 RepID=A0A2N3PML0_9PROT|nr:hypothetical protein CWS72_25850 [Telmatospirillum siberiense]
MIETGAGGREIGVIGHRPALVGGAAQAKGGKVGKRAQMDQTGIDAHQRRRRRQGGVFRPQRTRIDVDAVLMPRHECPPVGAGLKVSGAHRQ